MLLIFILIPMVVVILTQEIASITVLGYKPLERKKLDVFFNVHLRDAYISEITGPKTLNIPESSKYSYVSSSLPSLLSKYYICPRSFYDKKSYRKIYRFTKACKLMDAKFKEAQYEFESLNEEKLQTIYKKYN